MDALFELFNTPTRNVAIALLLIGFAIGVLFTYMLWIRKIRGLKGELTKQADLATQYESQVTSLNEEMALKETDLKKSALENVKLRQDVKAFEDQSQILTNENAVLKEHTDKIKLSQSASNTKIEDLENQILGLKSRNTDLTTSVETMKSSANSSTEIYSMKTKLAKKEADLTSAYGIINKLESERDKLKSENQDLKSKPVAAPAPLPQTQTQTEPKVIKRTIRKVAPVEAEPKKVTKKVVRKAAPATPEPIKRTPLKAKAKAPSKPKVSKTTKKAPAKKVTRRKDDLKKIEGIGPKIAQLLIDSNITTFNKLSKTKFEKLKKILSEAGSRYKMHDPGTWAEQAALAAKGDWDKLKTFQDFLKGGKDPGK